MKRKITIGLLASALITIILYSCARDSVDPQNNILKLEPVEYARIYSQSKTVLSGKNIQWEKARIFEHEDSVVLISVPIKNISGNIVEELTFRIDQDKMMGYLWKFESIDDFSSEDYNLPAHEIMKKTIGTVSYTALEGSMRYEYKIVKGEIINDIASKNGPGSIDSPRCTICHAATIPELVIPNPPKPVDPKPGNPQLPLPGTVILNPTDPQEDPCKKAAPGSAKASDLAKSAKFSAAKQGVLDAFAQNGGENGVSFGSNTIDGATQSTGVQELGQNSGSLSNSFAYPTADIHNHPGNTPPSAGDVYSMISYHNQHNSFQTRYVILSNGTVYALIITDAGAFNAFTSNYPPDQVPGNSPNFSGQMFDDWYNFTFDGYGNDEMALSNVLDKYDTGIALTKMDSNGNFKKVNIKQNNNGTYSQSNCP